MVVIKVSGASVLLVCYGLENDSPLLLFFFSYLELHYYSYFDHVYIYTCVELYFWLIVSGCLVIIFIRGLVTHLVMQK